MREFKPFSESRVTQNSLSSGASEFAKPLPDLTLEPDIGDTLPLLGLTPSSQPYEVSQDMTSEPHELPERTTIAPPLAQAALHETPELSEPKATDTLHGSPTQPLDETKDQTDTTTSSSGHRQTPEEQRAIVGAHTLMRLTLEEMGLNKYVDTLPTPEQYRFVDDQQETMEDASMDVPPTDKDTVIRRDPNHSILQEILLADMHHLERSQPAQEADASPADQVSEDTVTALDHAPSEKATMLSSMGAEMMAARITIQHELTEPPVYRSPAASILGHDVMQAAAERLEMEPSELATKYIKDMITGDSTTIGEITEVLGEEFMHAFTQLDPDIDVQAASEFARQWGLRLVPHRLRSLVSSSYSGNVMHAYYWWSLPAWLEPNFSE